MYSFQMPKEMADRILARVGKCPCDEVIDIVLTIRHQMQQQDVARDATRENALRAQIKAEMQVPAEAAAAPAA